MSAWLPRRHVDGGRAEKACLADQRQDSSPLSRVPVSGVEVTKVVGSERLNLTPCELIFLTPPHAQLQLLNLWTNFHDIELRT